MRRPLVMTSRVPGEMSFTSDIETVTLSWSRRMLRMGCAMSAGESCEVATW